MLNRIISYSFYLLFFFTPLFWSSLNYELFEYNKMILVYGFTVIITGAWLLKMVNEKKFTIHRTPLDIPLLLFLGANILSTIFSIDPHTSIWGYYSRSNGGLLSLISYLLLYYAFVSNMDFAKVKTTLKFGLVAGFLISIWAILEHFGVSFSCVLLRGDFNDSCWIQDVQARVFATLGQPNWLAGYLAMLVFPALYFLLGAKTKFQTFTYYLFSITYYLAFTFTYSRGPTLGLIAGIVIFLSFWLVQNRHNLSFLNRFWSRRSAPPQNDNSKLLFTVIGSFLIINLLFGSALTNFRLVSKFAAPTRPGISLPVTPSGGTQLENGGTESGQIRLIVWKGAIDIFKHFPIFGSGLETFAYSYYQYRPIEHNLTSEWDFLYNKAHNEYLNYLATTGIVGFGTYMLIIGMFIFWSIKRIMSAELRVKNYKINSAFYILISTLLAAYISYLIYDFFLFSVVIIAVFFYLFPAIAFVATNSVKPLILNPIPYLYRRPFYAKATRIVIVFLTIYFLYSVFQIWYADTIFAAGERSLDAGNPGRAYNLLSAASDLNKNEPFYASELAFAAAQASVSLQASDATLSASLKNQATTLTDGILKAHPKNVSFYRTAVRTYFELATIDKDYVNKTLAALDSAISLAPTDPKLYYNKALVLQSIGRKDEEITLLQETIKLKPNYAEATALLQEATAAGKTK